MNIGDKVNFFGFKLSKAFVIPPWMIAPIFEGVVVYVGEFYIGVELTKPKKFFEARPSVKQKFFDAGIKEPWVIGLNEEQQKMCLTVKKS